MSPKNEIRPVESNDPSLSPETNALVTDELQDIVRADRARVLDGTPDASGEEHATHTATGASFISLRLGGVLTGAVIVITLGIVLITRSTSVLVLIPVFLLLLVLVTAIIRMTNRMTAAPEHASPELSARLEAEGVGDPDRMLTDLVDEFTPPERRNGR